MIKNLSSEKIRLLASLLFNFIAKVPGIFSVFFILPLVSSSLGQLEYGELLSALALGSLCTIPFGGIKIIGRRQLAAAVGEGDQKKQANVFITITVMIGVVAFGSGIVIGTLTGAFWSRPVFILISLLPVVGGFLNVFDDLRSSYNEHYVTAVLQLIFQILVYSAVFFFGIPSGKVILSALVLMSPYALASLVTFILLLVGRPFLFRGKVKDVVPLIKPACLIIVADSVLNSILNFCVFWLTSMGEAHYAAWAGTYIRLFQSFLSPVLLILFPLSSYISMKWVSFDSKRRLFWHKAFIISGLFYGVFVGLAMAVVAPVYVDYRFNLEVRGDWIDVLALSVFMGAFVAQKTYTMFFYVVNEGRFISYCTTCVSFFGLIAAALAMNFVSPMRVIDVLLISTGLLILVLIIIEGVRSR